MEKIKRKKIIVGMSGGVDSTVAAALLKQQGFEVVGATMKLWKKKYGPSVHKNACYGPGEKNDIIAAKKACKKLGIRHIILNLAEEYEEYVLGYFKKEYLAGRTPNPCVVCNQKIKFGFLLEKIVEAGISFDFFATGHYARVYFDAKKKRYILLKGKDATKDQSYFLYRLNQKQLKKAFFPLGDYTKKDIKQMAVKLGLGEYAEKDESQDFAESGDYGGIIGKSHNKKGDIVNEQGEVVGTHDGFYNFTIGQRRGLNIGGLHEPYYVMGIDACKNRVMVGTKESVFSNDFVIGHANWIAFAKLNKKIDAQVMVRSSGELIDCQIIPRKKSIFIKLKKPCFAVAPGQSAVFYIDDMVLGGGIIEKKQ